VELELDLLAGGATIGETTASALEVREVPDANGNKPSSEDVEVCVVVEVKVEFDTRMAP
jgi:hypothetical protein